MYLFRTRTYLCSHHSVGSDLLTAKKPCNLFLFTSLKHGGRCVLKEKGEAEVVGLLIKMHHNIPLGANIILFKFREQTKLLLTPSCSYVNV